MAIETKNAPIPISGQESFVFCLSSSGVEIQATLIHFTRYLAAFEAYSPSVVLRTSEVLGDFRIVVDGRTLYSGRAVISSLVSAGSMTICEANLEEGWIDVESVTAEDKQLEGSSMGFCGDGARIIRSYLSSSWRSRIWNRC